MIHFVQCEVKKGKMHQVAWLPPEFAKKGKVIMFHEDNGWTINHVFTKVDYDISLEKKDWGLNLPKKHRTER